jgi:integrase
MPERVNIAISLLRDHHLTLQDIRVYCALSLRADASNKCSLSREEIRTISGVNRISYHIGKLLQFGYVRIDRNTDTTTYTLLEDLGEARLPEQTVGSFAREFFQYSEGVHTAKTQAAFHTAFAEFVRVEGDIGLKAVGIKQIEHFLSVKKAEASDWTARKYYIALRSAFQTAVRWELISVNPFGKVGKPKVREVIPAYFTESDFQLFLSANKDRDFAELTITGLLTGLRLGELLSLRWNDVDFSARTVLIHNSEGFTTKSKRSRIVPMSEELCGMLLERKNNVRSESDLVFSNRHGRKLNVGLVERKFKQTVRRAGLNDKLHFHSLRHSFASGLVAAGVSLYAVQKLLGHAQAKTTEIYSHLLPGELHNEVNTLATRFNIQHE